MNKNYFIILWENPLSYYFLTELIIEIRKKYNVYLFYLENIKETKLNLENFKRLKKIKISRINKTGTYIDKLIYIYFILKILFLIIIKRPKFIHMINRYAFIPNIIYNLFSKAKKIYHNLDYNLPKDHYQRVLNYLENISLRFCDILIVSHPKRLKFFRKKKKLIKVYFYNCLSLKSLNNSKIKKVKKKNKINKIFYFGSIGPGHSLDTLIKSMSFLDNSFFLSINGWITDKKYFLLIKELITKYSKENNIKLNMDVTNKFWKKEINSADIGIALYEPRNISHKFMIGASQKINIFLAYGLPILTSNSTDFLEFEKKYKCSKSVNISNPLSIARGIKFLLNKKVQKNTRHFTKIAFKNEFNFEKQFYTFQNLIY